MHITQIIKHPLLTEKNYPRMGDGYYTFAVDIRATKPQIKAAFATIFEVAVADVNIMRYKARPKRMGRFQGFTPRYKKAIIKLKPGEALDLFNANPDQASKKTPSKPKPIKAEVVKEANDGN